MFIVVLCVCLQVATALLAHVEPFVARANELLADPTNEPSRQATVKVECVVCVFLFGDGFLQELNDLIAAADRVSAPRRARSVVHEVVPEMIDCANKMLRKELTFLFFCCD